MKKAGIGWYERGVFEIADEHPGSGKILVHIRLQDVHLFYH